MLDWKNFVKENKKATNFFVSLRKAQKPFEIPIGNWYQENTQRFLTRNLQFYAQCIRFIILLEEKKVSR